MAQGADQGDLILPRHGVEVQRHIEAPVLAQRDGIGGFHSLAGFQDRGACRFLFRVDGALDLHGAEALLVWAGADLDALDVVGVALGLLLQSPDLLGEGVDDLILQGVTLAQMVRLQELQPGDFDIQIHLLFDIGISGAEGLDLGVGQGLLVDVLGGADRRFRGHDLADELLLGLHQLIEVAVEGVFRDVGEDLDFLVLVALSDDTALPLLKVGRPPRAIKVVQGDELCLDVGAGAHLLRGADEHPDLAGAGLAEEFLLLGLGGGGVDEGNLAFGDALLQELLLQIVVDVKTTVVVRRGEIAEDKLGRTLFLGPLPDLVDVLRAGGNLAVVVIRQPGVHEALVQGELASVVGDQQHVVLVGGDHLVPYLLGTLREAFHHLLLGLRGLEHHMAVVGFGNRELQHVGGLDIRGLLEHGHELGQIVETGKAGLGAVAGALRGKLDGRDGLTKGRGPGIKIEKPVPAQGPVLQILLHGIHLHHAVADGRTGGKDDASAARDLVQVAALHVQVAGLLGLGLRDAAHVPHLGEGREVFVVVGLVDEQTVHAQFLEGHDVILSALVVELAHLEFQGLLDLLELLDGEAVAPIALDLGNALHDLVDLLLKQEGLPLRRHGDLLKLAVTDDDGVVVAGGDP